MPKSKHPIEIKFSSLSRYHYYFFTVMFVIKIPLYWHLMDLIFVTPHMNYSCNNNGSLILNECPCDEPMWDRSVFTKTMQTKFNLVCHHMWLICFSQSMLFVGSLIGSLLFGFMSDRFGRLITFVICCLGLATSGCISILMPTIASLIFMRCVKGIFAGGSIVTGYVLVVEYCGRGYRDTVTALYHLSLTIGHVSLAGMSYLVRDCDNLQLALSIPVFICIMTKWMLYESPKWLMDSDQVGEAALVMQKLAKFNGEAAVPLEEIQQELENYQASISTNRHKRISFWQIFRHKKLRKNLLLMTYVYFVCGMGYYGVSQYIGNMSGNIHSNVAISGSVLLPGTIVTVLCLKLMSRRLLLMATNFFSGLFVIMALCMPQDYKTTRMVLACLGNTFFFMSFIVVFLYSVELFPTGVRNSVLGFLAMLTRIGQIVAPPINALDALAAGLVFGIAAIIGAMMCFPLPETKNALLPSTLEESESLPKGKLKHSKKEEDDT